MSKVHCHRRYNLLHIDGASYCQSDLEDLGFSSRIDDDLKLQEHQRRPKPYKVHTI